MRKLLIILSLLIIASCSNDQTYENEDVVAIVRGKEITMGDLRFRSEATDKVLLENIDEFLTEEVIIQEAKEIGLDVSEEVEKQMGVFGRYPSENNNTKKANEIKAFSEKQAKRFDMDVEEYYQEYHERTVERSAYINGYINEMLGDIQDAPDKDQYAKDADALIDELLKEYEDEIETLID
ncbi:hypothetical protein [Tenuibacillus multivorans]|uniref:SurA N-terminal domain-containing protein n=1 Tax=Tenuibacillus multivorans TaxID=237069 RepID=A0A1G9Z5T1_9BACI|nr:hypothetical protein [Tenuibacillus multivorans]GEL77420.1 hypothetical protein TMU01_16550 [Tenuibacillus multivorans]SDN15986.1 hypothetical protein SAMN05216498_1518 [Tenuibacillus multivorans]